MRGGNDDVSNAIREIEQVEDQLNQMEGMEEVRKRLTNARAELVDALLEEHFERFDLKKEFVNQVEDAPPGSTIIFDEAAGEISLRESASDSNVNLDKTLLPICPNCGAEGERQRKARGKNRCLECGTEYE